MVKKSIIFTISIISVVMCIHVQIFMKIREKSYFGPNAQIWWWYAICLYCNGISSSHLYKIWFLSDFHENLHMDAHYNTNYGYCENNAFFHHQGWWQYCFLLFQLLLSTFIDMAFINGPYDDLITTKKLIRYSPSEKYFFDQLN